mmetsp:Transcript_20308/g.47703  ORF Transcript_20308/g.47703 Transcript_20308/m.47703 type:complete len:90 (-) Transcript_20308:308-577(-)
MGTCKYLKPRKRRTMTPEEHAQRAKKRHGTESIANFFSTAPGSNVDEDDMDVDEQQQINLETMMAPEWWTTMTTTLMPQTTKESRVLTE